MSETTPAEPTPPVLRLIAELRDGGKRLDQMLHERLPAFSRSRLQEWIRAGRVQVDGRGRRPSYLLRAGETVDVAPAELAPLRATPEEIPLVTL
jgi:23S rRNA pseudouridine1911/1915/1917 synthase